MNQFKFIIIIALLVSVGSVYNIAKAEGDLSLGLSATLTSNSKETSDPDHITYSSFGISPSVKLSKKTSAGASFGYSKELTNNREGSVNDASLSLGHSLGTFYKSYIIKLGLSSVIPLSDVSRDRVGLITNLRFSPGFTIDFSKLKLARRMYIKIPGLTFTFAPSFTKNLHEYKTTTSGVSNTNYAFTQVYTLGYSFLDSFSASISFVHSTGWTYEDTRKDSSFSLSQSLSYSYKRYSFTIGHTNSGSVLAANGRDTDIKPFDEDSSMYYFSVGCSF